MSVYRKTFLRSVDRKQSKNVKFSLWSIIETSQGELHDFSGEVQKFSGGGGCKTISGEVRTSSHLPSKSGHGVNGWAGYGVELPC
jgi:hypothetical protein